MLFQAGPGFSQVAVIANKSVPLDSLKKVELINIYTGDIREWGNGAAVLVKDLKPKGPTKKAFYKFIGKSSSRMKSIWLKKLLSGEGDPPEALESEEVMINSVANSPGAIGFVSQSKLTPNVKTLLVIDE